MFKMAKRKIVHVWLGIPDVNILRSLSDTLDRWIQTLHLTAADCYWYISKHGGGGSTQSYGFYH